MLLIIPCFFNHLKAQPLWILLVSFLGFLLFLKNLILLIKWLYKTFLRKPKDLKKYGSWAMITGSTDGVGRAFAFKFAEKGLNLVLISRNHTKLQTVASQIQTKYPNIKTKIFELDFSKSDVALKVERLVKEVVKGLDVGVLVNNVGVTYPRAMYFHEVDEGVWMDLVKVNVVGTSCVTRGVLEGMVERKRGAVVCIGSGASIVVPSHPLYAIYAATKAYVDQFSRSLYVEYKDRGIDVQCQVPLYICTKMASKVALVEEPSFFVPSAEDYVEAAVRYIGHQEARCTPYWSHSLQWCFASLLPDTILDAWRLSIGLRRMRLNTD